MVEARDNAYRYSVIGNYSNGRNPYSIAYDRNGNIKALGRAGLNEEYGTFGGIDNLAYTYEDNSNRLLKVTDMASAFNNDRDYGFKDGNTNGDDYGYDANGNMVEDKNKGIASITYNHLNLPTLITFNDGSSAIKNISYIYDATGTKLRKSVYQRSGSSSGNTMTTYASGYVYKETQTCSGVNTDHPTCLSLGAVMQFFNHPEGYVDAVNGYKYVYQYKDHLGNIRLSYKDVSTTSTPVLQILEENNYYPFGLEHKGYNNDVPTAFANIALKKTYNGKEFQDELGLNWHDYGARNYDTSLGRWMNIDPKADVTRDTYGYVYNNPIQFVDENGEFPILSGAFGFFKGLFRNRSNFESGATTRLGSAFRSAARYEKQAWQIIGGLGTTDKNKTLGGKGLQLLSRFTWELPNTVAGFVTAESTNAFANVNWVEYEAGATVLNTEYVFGAFTLGSFIIGDYQMEADRNYDVFQHEYGHYLQSQSFGPGYLPGFALPSVIRAGLWNMGIVGGGYDDFYTENNATKRGDKYFNSSNSSSIDISEINFMKRYQNQAPCHGCYAELPKWLTTKNDLLTEGN